MTGIWLFGYGSLIWRPDFAYRERRSALLHGWARRFWQGSHDHRGLPHAPGRVVTLVPDAEASCHGVAYLIDRAVAHAVFANIDHREKNGYERTRVRIDIAPGGRVDGVVYIAPERNAAYLGPAPLAEMARQIAGSHGPSGSNAEYLLELATALRALGASDAHVFELEQAVERQVAGGS